MVQVGLAGFLVIIRFSSVKAIADKIKKTKFSHTVEDKSSGPSSGKAAMKTPRKAEMLGDYGSLETPVGRRSARIAVKSAQKEH